MRSPIALAALVLSSGHFLARPHVLALPVMLAWAYGLMSASERRQVAVVLAAAADRAVGEPARRLRVRSGAGRRVRARRAVERRALRNEGRWRCAGRCSASRALAACCVTPYGWGSILASRKILDLGELLHLIYEWMPADFSKFGGFELAILALIAARSTAASSSRRRGSRWCWACFTWRCRMSGTWRSSRCCCRSSCLAPVASQFALRGWNARPASRRPSSRRRWSCRRLGRGCSPPTYGYCAARQPVAGGGRRCAEGVSIRSGSSTIFRSAAI